MKRLYLSVGYHETDGRPGPIEAFIPRSPKIGLVFNTRPYIFPILIKCAPLTTIQCCCGCMRASASGFSKAPNRRI